MLGIDVSAQIHGVVKDSADYQHVAVTTTDKEVSRAADSAPRGVSAALRQVPGEHAVPQFRAGCMP